MDRSDDNFDPVNEVVVEPETEGGRTPWRLGLEPMRYKVAYFFLIVVSSLDIIMTYLIVFHERAGSVGWELNPFANRVIRQHGHWGMIIYKFALMVFFIVLCEEIGRRKPLTGRRMSQIAIAISSIPILWALFLLSVA